MKNVFHYSETEEKANAFTHFLGALFALFVIYDLFMNSMDLGWFEVASYAVFGITLLFMYTSSTFYHLEKEEVRKRFLKRTDHVSIFLLIAGTATPLLMVNMRNETGVWYCLFLWTFALVGSIYKITTKKERERISLFFYLAMGWSAVFFWKELKVALPQDALDNIIFGGIAYTSGTIFYSMKKVTFHHAVWHLFVMAGTYFHYNAVKLAMP